MPDWKHEIRLRLAGVKLAPARETAIMEELTQFLDDYYAELLASGPSEEEAYRRTLTELEGSELLAHELRRAEWRVSPEPIALGTDRRANMIADLWQDLRYGARMILKTPGFSAVVALTLALGIGANAALFSVVNGVLLNPLPYPQPEQLVTLHQSKPHFATGSIPYPNFRDWQKENQTFSAMAISRPSTFSMIGVGEPEQVDGRWISAEFFFTLGVKPALGRDFAPDEDERGVGPVVLISAGLWRRKFGGSPDVLGKSLTLDDKSYAVVGVLPASFTLFRGVDVYLPIGQWNNPKLQDRSAGLALHGVGRLKPGVTLAQAQADLDGVMRRLAEAYPDSNRGNGAALVPLKERLVGDVGPVLWVLLGAVGFVLLIACVNVSNLLLARSGGRASEFAIRAALGARQGRLLRQLLAESMLFALAGGGMGLAVAALGTRAALAALPMALPRAEEVELDGRVMLFTFAVSTLAGALSGLAPALKSSQWRLAKTLKGGGRAMNGARLRAQGLMIVIEMALAVVLLIGAGLMIRSLNGLWNIDPGFRPDNVLTFGLRFPPAIKAAGPDVARANLRELSDRLNSLPGVKAASCSAGATPLQGIDNLFFWLADQPKPASASEMPVALHYRVEPGYLTAMGIPLKRGRFFTAQDDERSQPVAVIDEVLARQYFSNTDPIGKRINVGSDRDPLQIIGVVGHVKQWGLDSDDKQLLQAQLYEPLRQMSGSPSGVGVVARVEGVAGRDASALYDVIRRAVHSQHSQNVIFGMQTMNQVVADSLGRQRFSMILLNAFAAVALLLASVGLYGVISYLVSQRTQELGVRIALGAKRADVLWLVLSQSMKMALGGLALGLLAALGLTGLLDGLLYGVSATDPATFAGIALLLVVVALAACFVPAWRATKVDPMVALRQA